MASQSVSSKLTFHPSQPASVRMRLSKDATSASGVRRDKAASGWCLGCIKTSERANAIEQTYPRILA